jgi:hypothetical protein
MVSSLPTFQVLEDDPLPARATEAGSAGLVGGTPVAQRLRTHPLQKRRRPAMHCDGLWLCLGSETKPMLHFFVEVSRRNVSFGSSHVRLA